MSRECKLDEDMMSKQRDQLAEATQKVIQSFPLIMTDRPTNKPADRRTRREVTIPITKTA